MAEIDELVRRTVATVTKIADRATAFATRLLIGTVVVCVGGFLLGVSALSGGVESVWIVLGIVFGAIAIGCASVARWRVGAVRRHTTELATEVRALITDGGDAHRTVIDTFVVDDDADPSDPTTPGGGSAIVMSRQMHGFREIIGPGAGSAPRLTAAVMAMTSFPILALGAVLISLVFGFLGFIFLIALAL